MSRDDQIFAGAGGQVTDDRRFDIDCRIHCNIRRHSSRFSSTVAPCSVQPTACAIASFSPRALVAKCSPFQSLNNNLTKILGLPEHFPSANVLINGEPQPKREASPCPLHQIHPPAPIPRLPPTPTPHIASTPCYKCYRMLHKRDSQQPHTPSAF